MDALTGTRPENIMQSEMFFYDLISSQSFIIITMGFLPGRILPLLTQSLLVVKISPRLDQGVECPAGDGDDGDDHGEDHGADGCDYGCDDDVNANISPRLNRCAKSHGLIIPHPFHKFDRPSYNRLDS